MSSLTLPEDGMVIRRDTTFEPGVYYLPNGIEIAEDNVTLDGNGALLIGNGFAGRGVRINQRLGVTVRNLGVERYYHGIWANASANIRLENNRVTRTHELAGFDTFLDVWLDRGAAYGGGIFLSGVADSVVTGNDAQHQQNGIMLYGSNTVEISGNNCSFNSGYGILLYESSLNVVDHNVADFCSRIYHASADGERYHNGADAAGLVIMCSSSKNTVTRNKLRGGGDGVFLGGFHKDQIMVPCNDNLFEANDGSWSPNIAFEATFSARNIFRNNRADKCKYGFWLGYSRENVVEGNSIKDNWIAGVAIEHGGANRIVGNTFERNRYGVQLWCTADPRFGPYFPDLVESHDTQVSRNSFLGHEAGVHVWTERGVGPRCRAMTVSENTITGNQTGVLFERVRESTIFANRIYGNIEAGIKLIGSPDINTSGNQLAPGA